MLPILNNFLRSAHMRWNFPLGWFRHNAYVADSLVVDSRIITISQWRPDIDSHRAGLGPRDFAILLYKSIPNMSTHNFSTCYGGRSPLKYVSTILPICTISLILFDSTCWVPCFGGEVWFICNRHTMLITPSVRNNASSQISLPRHSEACYNLYLHFDTLQHSR